MKVLRPLAAEFLGTAILLAVVVGSGIMAERLAGGNVALALLANAIATGAGLSVLILVFGPVSGAHFNPLVTLAQAAQGHIRWNLTAAYVGTQTIGAIAGVACAHAMFSLPLFALSTQSRTGMGQWWSEFVATAGLILVIEACVRQRPAATAYAVGAYILSAYWFTASTSFANPAVTLARSLTPTFTGIQPADVLMFIVAELAGAAAGLLVARSLFIAHPAEQRAG